MLYRGCKVDILDDGFCFIWYKTELVGMAFSIKYAKKRIDSFINTLIANKNI